MELKLTSDYADSNFKNFVTNSIFERVKKMITKFSEEAPVSKHFLKGTSFALNEHEIKNQISCFSQIRSHLHSHCISEKWITIGNFISQDYTPEVFYPITTQSIFYFQSEPDIHYLSSKFDFSSNDFFNGLNCFPISQHNCSQYNDGLIIEWLEESLAVLSQALVKIEDKKKRKLRLAGKLRIFYDVVRDIRSSFRKLVSLMFKSMSDVSGSDLSSFSFNAYKKSLLNHFLKIFHSWNIIPKKLYAL